MGELCSGSHITNYKWYHYFNTFAKFKIELETDRSTPIWC